jgi:glycosyltransferase involved in cell wall biosynthesis
MSRKIAVTFDKFLVEGGAEKVLEQIDDALRPDEVHAVGFSKGAGFDRYRSRLKMPWWAFLIKSNTIFMLLYPLICIFSTFHQVKTDVTFAYSSTSAKFFKSRGDAVLYTNYPAKGILHPELFIGNKFLLWLARPIVRYFRHFEARQYRKFKNIYSISKTTQSVLLTEFGVNSEVLYCPILARYFEAFEVVPMRDRSNYMVLVSRLEKHKKLDEILSFCNTHSVPLKVIGTGSLKTVLQKKYSNIDFAGLLDEDALIHELRHAKALIFPTPQEYSMTMIEAFSQGTPAIAVKCGATSELLIDRQLGKRFFLGATYKSDNISSIKSAFDWFEQHRLDFNPIQIRAAVSEFNPEIFKRKLRDLPYLKN